MVNLVDTKLPKKSFDLKEGGKQCKFVMFVEKTQNSHSCTILALMYDEESQTPFLKSFKYRQPFDIKNFNSDHNWSVRITKISSQASRFINQVLFYKDFK